MISGLKKVALLSLIAGAGTVECASYFRRAAASLGSALYWLGTLGAPIGVGCQLGLKKGAEELLVRTDMVIDKKGSDYPNAAAFAQGELKKLGLPHTHVVPFLGSAALINHIGIDKSFLSAVEGSLARRLRGGKQNQEDNDVINKYKGLLHSKAYQLKHEDNKRGVALALAAAAVPFVARPIIRSFRPVASQATTWLNARKALEGQSNAFVANSIVNYGNRVMEREADEATIDVEAIAGSRMLKEEQKCAFYATFKDKPLLGWALEKTISSSYAKNCIVAIGKNIAAK